MNDYSPRHIGSFKRLKTLASIESVSSRVSDKYVPIYTSEIIEKLNPDYKFQDGTIYYNCKSMHSVNLKNKEGDTITIFNSYDRSAAFSLRYTLDNISIPLDLDRQVHIGENAAELTSNIEINKAELNKAVSNAKRLVNGLKDTAIPNAVKAEITDVIFKDIKSKDNFKSLDMTVASSYNNFFSYINTVVNRFVEGDYYVEVQGKNGLKHQKGKKIKNKFRKLQMTNRIYQYIENNLQEALI